MKASVVTLGLRNLIFSSFFEKKKKQLLKLLQHVNINVQMQLLCVETDVPVLLFEDNGSLIYSPVNKIKDRCSARERRMKEMKEKRIDLSPTGKKLNFTYP